MKLQIDLGVDHFIENGEMITEIYFNDNSETGFTTPVSMETMINGLVEAYVVLAEPSFMTAQDATELMAELDAFESTVTQALKSARERIKTLTSRGDLNERF